MDIHRPTLLFLWWLHPPSPK